jgi:hypothetical protein
MASKATPGWLAERLNVEEGRELILALENDKYDAARQVADSLFCSVVSIGKFGDRVALGYKVVYLPLGKEFWIWGSDRQISNFEVHVSFTRQIATQLGSCC